MRDILSHAQLLTSQYDDTIGGTLVEYKYKDKVYAGYACCHDEDKEFYSPKVGRYIATARARVSILLDIVNKLQQEVKWKRCFYNEALGLGIKSPEIVDPTNAFANNLMRAEARLKRYKAALKNAKADLRNYIKSQDQFVKSVRAMREDKDKND